MGFLRDSKRKMKELQRRHLELRKEYVESLAEALVLKRFPTAEVGTAFFNEQKEKQLKSLSNWESARAMHGKIRHALKRRQGGGTTRVDIPDTSELRSPEGEPYGDPGDPKKWKNICKMTSNNIIRHMIHPSHKNHSTRYLVQMRHPVRPRLS